MQLVYKFDINYYDRLCAICRVTNNLYNQALYIVRNELKDNDRWLFYPDLDRIMKNVTNLEGTINYRLVKSHVAQQTNGLYCRFSTIVDTVTHYNMTKDDYIEVCKDRLGKKRGEEEANDILKNYMHPFNDVLEQFIPNNDSVEEFNIRLKEMGYMDEFNG